MGDREGREGAGDRKGREAGDREGREAGDRKGREGASRLVYTTGCKMPVVYLYAVVEMRGVNTL